MCEVNFLTAVSSDVLEGGVDPVSLVMMQQIIYAIKLRFLAFDSALPFLPDFYLKVHDDAVRPPLLVHREHIAS